MSPSVLPRCRDPRSVRCMRFSTEPADADVSHAPTTVCGTFVIRKAWLGASNPAHGSSSRIVGKFGTKLKSRQSGCEPLPQEASHIAIRNRHKLYTIASLRSGGKLGTWRTGRAGIDVGLAGWQFIGPAGTPNKWRGELDDKKASNKKRNEIQTETIIK